MHSMKLAGLMLALTTAQAVHAQQSRDVFLRAADGTSIKIATLEIDADGTYTQRMNDDAFTDHFLSMRPFKCIEGPKKTWCHVPYPYDIARDISNDTTDLEYDFLFLWKGRTDYGINMWNGIYYEVARDGDAYVGQLHEMDMDLLSAPPDKGVMRPLRAQDIIESDPDSHWLPTLVIQ